MDELNNSNFTPAFEWTTARIDLLRKLKGDGLSSSEIGVELGITRNAVIGKAARLGIGGGQAKGAQREAKHYAPKAGPVFQINFGHLRAQKAARQRGERPAPPPPPVLTTRPCSILELTSATCRWPMGEPDEPGFHFCGSAPRDGKPYCGFHCGIAYRPVAARTRSPFIPPRGAAA
jgi:GcrA cell cycle regulator